MTKQDIRKRQQRRTAQLIGNSDVNMGAYLESMQEDCKSCPTPLPSDSTLPSTAPTHAPSVTVTPSSTPSSNPTRDLPGKTFFGPERCFCARTGPEFAELTVGLGDTFNTTFEEERNDGKYKGFDSYKSVQFGNMGGGSGGGGGGGGGNRRGRATGRFRK